VNDCKPPYARDSAQSIVNFFYHVEMSQDANNETKYSVTPFNDTTTGAAVQVESSCDP
jgi:hypothetical protein